MGGPRRVILAAALAVLVVGVAAYGYSGWGGPYIGGFGGGGGSSSGGGGFSGFSGGGGSFGGGGAGSSW